MDFGAGLRVGFSSVKLHSTEDTQGSVSRDASTKSTTDGPPISSPRSPGFLETAPRGCPSPPVQKSERKGQSFSEFLKLRPFEGEELEDFRKRLRESLQMTNRGLDSQSPADQPRSSRSGTNKAPQRLHHLPPRRILSPMPPSARLADKKIDNLISLSNTNLADRSGDPSSGRSESSLSSASENSLVSSRRSSLA